MSWPVLAGDQADVEADETVGVAVVVEEDTVAVDPVAVDPEDTAAAAAEAEGTATQASLARAHLTRNKLNMVAEEEGLLTRLVE